MGIWVIYLIIDFEDEIFVQGLKEDEWIIENVDWLMDLFFDVGILFEVVNYWYFFQVVNLYDWCCISCVGCM